MHNPASVLENETHKLLWDFEIQTDHLISARRPHRILINQNRGTSRIVDVAVPIDNRVKVKESEKKDQYLDLVREFKKTVEHESDVYTNCNWCCPCIYHRIVTETWRTRSESWEESWRFEENRSHSNFSAKPSANAGVKNSKRNNNNIDFERSPKKTGRIGNQRKNWDHPDYSIVKIGLNT